jgi:hypothetical protein
MNWSQTRWHQKPQRAQLLKTPQSYQIRSKTPKYSKNIAWRLVKHYISEGFGGGSDVVYCDVGGSEVDLDPDDQLRTYAGFDVIGDVLVVFFVDQVIPDAEVRYTTVIMTAP